MLLNFNSLAILAHKKGKENPPDEIIREAECAKVSPLVELGLGCPCQTAQHCSLICLSSLLMGGILRKLRDGNSIQQI